MVKQKVRGDLRQNNAKETGHPPLQCFISRDLRHMRFCFQMTDQIYFLLCLSRLLTGYNLILTEKEESSSSLRFLV